MGLTLSVKEVLLEGNYDLCAARHDQDRILIGRIEKVVPEFYKNIPGHLRST